MNIPSSLNREAEEVSENLLSISQKTKERCNKNEGYEKLLAWLKEENVMPQ